MSLLTEGTLNLFTADHARVIRILEEKGMEDPAIRYAVESAKWQAAAEHIQEQQSQKRRDPDVIVD